MVKLVIFDLDGTLLNTIDDLADCTNYVLQKNGFPEYDTNAYKYFVGNGVDILIQRALPKDITEETYLKVLQDFRKYYAIHKEDKTAPYEGMVETLEQLQEKGILPAVATNKPQELLPDLMRFYFPKIRWAAIFGNRKEIPIKPNPQIVYDILEVTQIDKNNVLYVGDTATDMETAHNAGVTSVGALWGFRTEKELKQANAEYLIAHPLELLNLV